MLGNVLREIDVNNSMADHQNTGRHQVCYSHSRTIIRYVENDVELAAYAFNPGNAIVIFNKNEGLIAYGCYLDSFPVSNGWPNFHWAKLKVEEAICLIKKDIWQESNYDQNIQYHSTEKNWEEIACGVIEYTSSYRNSQITISQFREEYGQYIYDLKYTIFRLKSGKLRVEVQDSYFPFDDFLKILLFFQDEDRSSKAGIRDLPEVDRYQKALSIDQPANEIIDELKCQVVAKKMKEAAQG